MEFCARVTIFCYWVKSASVGLGETDWYVGGGHGWSLRSHGGYSLSSISCHCISFLNSASPCVAGWLGTIRLSTRQLRHIWELQSRGRDPVSVTSSGAVRFSASSRFRSPYLLANSWCLSAWDFSRLQAVYVCVPRINMWKPFPGSLHCSTQRTREISFWGAQVWWQRAHRP